MKMTPSKHNFLPFCFPFPGGDAGRRGQGRGMRPYLPAFTQIARKQQSREVKKVRSHPCLSFPVLADWKRETNGQRIDIFVTKTLLTSTAMIAKIDRKIKLKIVEAIMNKRESKL